MIFLLLWNLKKYVFYLTFDQKNIHTKIKMLSTIGHVLYNFRLVLFSNI